MGFFTLFDTGNYLDKEDLDEGGNGFFGGGLGDSTYEQRTAQRNRNLMAERQQRKQQQNTAANAAFQKQANPLDPAFAQGQVTEAPQQEWENMQRRIYGG